MENKDIRPLTDLFGSDTQGRLIFDLVRTLVADRIKIQALEKILVSTGVIDEVELRQCYEELLAQNSDDVINEVLHEFGNSDSDF